MVTKEGPTKIINFMTQGAGVHMLKRGHIRYNSEYALSSTLSPRRWRSGIECRPESGRLGVRIQAATDLSRKKQVVIAPPQNLRQ